MSSGIGSVLGISSGIPSVLGVSSGIASVPQCAGNELWHCQRWAGPALSALPCAPRAVHPQRVLESRQAAGRDPGQRDLRGARQGEGQAHADHAGPLRGGALGPGRASQEASGSHGQRRSLREVRLHPRWLCCFFTSHLTHPVKPVNLCSKRASFISSACAVDLFLLCTGDLNGEWSPHASLQVRLKPKCLYAVFYTEGASALSV